MSRRISVRVLMVLVPIGLLALVGCGGGQAPKRGAPVSQSELEIMAKREVGGAQKEAGGEKDAGKNGGAVDPAATSAPAKPMIIYTYTLDIVVKDLEVANAEVEKLVAGHKGYIAKSEMKGDTGSRRTTTYTLRIPVGADKPLKEGLLALGVPERNAVETQDVSEEFVDVEKRIKNLKEQEEKLNELLKEKRKEEKLDDVIKVSDRIFLVRGDIERAQGRREYLLNRTSYSTVYLTLREIKDYKPPTAATFGNRISETFEASWEGLVGFGQGVVLVAVAVTPWAPLWLPGLFLVVWMFRRLARESRESAAKAEHEREEREARRRRPPREEPPAGADPVNPSEPGPAV